MSGMMDGCIITSKIEYQTDNINPPVAKILFQNIWEIFENMKTQKKTFGKIFVEISNLQIPAALSKPAHIQIKIINRFVW